MDISPIFEDFKTHVIPKPSKQEKSTNSELLVEYKTDMAIFVKNVKEYVKKRNILKENIQRLYSII